MAILCCYRCVIAINKLFLMIVLTGYVKSNKNEDWIRNTDKDYGIVIDAGSSGSRVRVYSWIPRVDLHHVPKIEEVDSYTKKPGISEFVDNLKGLESYIQHLVLHAEKLVPVESHSHTPIYVLATAGMRLLLEHHANSVISKIDNILQNKSNNPFQYKEKRNTRILSGEEEGVFAWITTNYLREFFNIPDRGSAGILEMGGASTQIAFTHSGSILADKFPVTIAGRIYPLYVHSYLTFGQDHLLERIKESLHRVNATLKALQDPCMLKGDNRSVTTNNRTLLFVGTGDPSTCLDIINKIVYKVKNKDHCYPKPCAIGSVYQPSIKNQTFYAISAFKFTLKNIGAIDYEDHTFSPAETLEAAFRYCSKHIDDVRNERKQMFGDEDYNYFSTECAMGLYIPVLLVKGYGFLNTTRQLTAVKQINNHNIEWPLGALIYEIDRRDWTCVLPRALATSGFPYGGVPLVPIILTQLYTLFILQQT